MLVERVLFVCTANQCRSPIAAALLQSVLRPYKSGVVVASAGLLPGGAPAPQAVLELAESARLDLSAHVSQQVDEQLLASADLILGLERFHVREVVLIEPRVWPRTFTLREFVRRGAEAGPRNVRDPLEEWLKRIHTGRQHAEMLGASSLDDVSDPMGQPFSEFQRMLAELNALIQAAAQLGWDDRPG